jgi:hypothetical protein
MGSFSAESNQSITALTISVGASAVLLLLDITGLRLPTWSIYLVNPIAWISNLSGLTTLGAGFLVGMDLGVQRFGVWIGIPVIGSFVLWFLISFSWIRFRAIHFLFFVILGSVAFQFTMQRTYLSMADYYKARNEIRRASDALEKVLYVVEKTGAPGVLMNSRAVIQKAVELGRLQEGIPGRQASYSAPPIKFRIANVTVTMESDHQPLMFPLFAEKSTWFKSYKLTLSEILKDFDLKDFSRLNVLDLRLIAGMDVAATLGMQHRQIESRYKNEAEHYLSQPLSLTVRIHRSLQELANEVGRKAKDILAEPGKGGEFVAFYDRNSRSLHIAVPDEVYRKNVIRIMDSFLDKGLLFGSEGIELYRYMDERLNAPLTHELWHFASQQIPIFEGLPVALEEGMACFFQFITETVTQSVTENPSLMEWISQGKYRDPEREKQLVSSRHCPKNAIRFRDAILHADRSGKLVPTHVLLSLNPSSLHARPDVELLYAEGWALSMRIWFDRKLFPLVRERLSRLSSTDRTKSPEEQDFWDYLDKEMVETARIACEQIYRRGDIK